MGSQTWRRVRQVTATGANRESRITGKAVGLRFGALTQREHRTASGRHQALVDTAIAQAGVGRLAFAIDGPGHDQNYTL
jgi:hypothetical protein